MKRFSSWFRFYRGRPCKNGPEPISTGKKVSTINADRCFGVPIIRDMHSRRTKRILSTSFFILLCLGLSFWAYAQRTWLLQGDWRTIYGVTEWMINYQGGFLRRGLPGEMLLFIGRQTGLDIGWIVVMQCMFFYGAYVIIMVRYSKGTLPQWMLWTAPLLGYPVYSGDVIRKDVLLLLLLIALLKVITHLRHGPLRQILIGAISSLALFSHELFFFFGLPMSFFADAIICQNTLKRKSMPNRSLYFAMGWLPALVASFLVFRFKGTTSQASEILDSWSSLSPAGEQIRSQLPGALSWLGRTSQDTIGATHHLLLSTHFGFPLWLFVILATSIAALVITSMCKTDDKSRDFAFFFLVQSVFMSPIYFSALDQGRWIFVTINSALIYSLALDQIFFAKTLFGVERWAHCLRTAISPVTSLIVLSFWGFPHTGWSLTGWLRGTPLFSLPTKVYFYMRSNGILPELL